MDYEGLAAEFLSLLPRLIQIPMQKNADRLVRGEMFALEFLSEAGPQAPGKISTEMHISTARTAKLLTALETKGFIVRVPDAGDKRKICVTLTEQGARHIAAHRRLFLRSVADAMAALGEHDAVEYVRITKRILENAAEKETAVPCSAPLSFSEKGNKRK